MRGRVLIVGAAGVFGGRLAAGLAETTDAELILAGRSRAPLERLAQSLPRARVVVLDRLTVSPSELRALGAHVVVDAAGPFQGASHDFARAVVSADAHYLDLADARDFVAGIGALDVLARQKGRAAIAGASSTPAITHAALDALCAGWRRIDTIRAGIAPGNRAPRGRALVEAILSRAGAPTRVFDDGAWRDLPGWSHRESVRIEGLGRRRFALVETPDLDLIPARFAVRDSALFLASLELGFMQRGVEAVAALRRWGMWRQPERMAGLFRLGADLVQPFGSDRGAMFVEVLGRDAEDCPSRARWTLIAPEGRGPIVPTLPALVLVRKLLRGEGPPPGARACVGMLSLDDLAPDFTRLGLDARIERERLVSPFERALGARFVQAPAPVVRAHRAGPVARTSGAARIMPPGSPLAAFIARCVGFPRAGVETPVRVTMRLGASGVETWRREFGDQRFQSELTYRGPGVVRERFGPFSFDMKLDADVASLSIEVIGWRIGFLPLPLWLAPRSRAVESADAAGRFHFDVPVTLPLLGRLTHYSGWLSPDSDDAAEIEGAA